MSGLWLSSYIALWVLTIFITIIVLGLARQLSIISIRLGDEENLLVTKDGLDIGSLAPAFSALDIVHNEQLTLENLFGRDSVLIFVSTGCRPCHELLPDLAGISRSWNGKINLILISQDGEFTKELAMDYELNIPVLIDLEGNIARTYVVRATPFAYRLDEGGTVKRRGIVNNRKGLEELLLDASLSESEVELPKAEKHIEPRN